MKIICQGVKPEEKVYRSKCRSCQSIFEYEAKEAEYVIDDRTGDYLKIKCPVCGVLNSRSLKWAN